MQNTKITCPVCGASFALPEHEHFAVGTAVGKDSGLGEIHPALEDEGNGNPRKGGRAQARLDALKAAGFDTSGLFALQGAAGADLLVRTVDGVPTVVADDDPMLLDPTYLSIINGATIPERRLFRRWVMAQAFRMLSKGYTKALKEKGYRYMWKMTLEELRVQARLAVNDPENFKARNRWFNRRLIVAMAEDYRKKLSEVIDSLPLCKYKGHPYVRLDGRNILLTELDKEIWTPIAMAVAVIEHARSPKALYVSVQEFLDIAPKIPEFKDGKRIPQCKQWVAAYEGAGAYFSLKNLILFHGVILNYSRSFDALAFLEMKAERYKNKGWALLGLLKQTLSDNDIDIEAKRKEWYEAKKAKAEAALAAA